MARRTAITEKHSDDTRPGSHGRGHSLSRSNHVHQFSEKRVSWEHRVGTGHRVTAREETVLLTVSQKTMQKKAALPKGEDDLTARYIVE